MSAAKLVKTVTHAPHLAPRPQAQAAGPGVVRVAGNAAGALVRGIRSGFAKVDAETLAAREGKCRPCEHWEPEAFFGLGRCRKCGCSGIKLSFAAERCPEGKWEAVGPAATG